VGPVRERVAAIYDAASAAMSDPDVVTPAVETLAELAGDMASCASTPWGRFVIEARLPELRRLPLGQASARSTSRCT
jgi:hypothetical protein